MATKGQLLRGWICGLTGVLACLASRLPVAVASADAVPTATGNGLSAAFDNVGVRRASPLPRLPDLRPSQDCRIFVRAGARTPLLSAPVSEPE